MFGPWIPWNPQLEVGYAVCTSCAFLRAYSEKNGSRPPEACPACGGHVEFHDPKERFQPAYVGRVSVEIHSAPPLRH